MTRRKALAAISASSLAGCLGGGQGGGSDGSTSNSGASGSNSSTGSANGSATAQSSSGQTALAFAPGSESSAKVNGQLGSSNSEQLSFHTNEPFRIIDKGQVSAKCGDVHRKRGFKATYVNKSVTQVTVFAPGNPEFYNQDGVYKYEQRGKKCQDYWMKTIVAPGSTSGSETSTE